MHNLDTENPCRCPGQHCPQSSGCHLVMATGCHTHGHADGVRFHTRSCKCPIHSTHSNRRVLIKCTDIIRFIYTFITLPQQQNYTIIINPMAKYYFTGVGKRRQYVSWFVNMRLSDRLNENAFTTSYWHPLN